MTASTIHVSNTILNRSFEDNLRITPMKLQRILYFVASEYAKQTGKNLFDEQFQAWKYGPVLVSVYTKFGVFKGENINVYGKDAVGNAYMVDERANPVLTAIVDRVWFACKNIPAVTLSRLAVGEGSAHLRSDDLRIKHYDVKEDISYRQVLGL